MGYAARRAADGTPTDFFQALNTQPPWRLVLDTNVVLDLLHFLDLTAAPILQAIENRRAQCYASQASLAELKRVLAYPEFDLGVSAQTALMAQYESWINVTHTVANVHPKLPRCADPDDQMFLELAASVPADWLITKDKALLALRHRVSDFKILTPVEATMIL